MDEAGKTNDQGFVVFALISKFGNVKAPLTTTSPEASSI